MKERMIDFGRDNWKYILAVVAIVIALIVIVVLVITKKHSSSDAAGNSYMSESLSQDANDDSNSESESDSVMESDYIPVEDVVDEEDPQTDSVNMGQETGASVEVEEVVTAAQEAAVSSTAMGIDVSSHQGKIDWKQVAESGVRFAMIRVGYRTTIDGVLTEDVNAKYNMQQALANGIAVGVYFYSTAISEEEAVEEANFVSGIISGFAITYPVAYDCEGFRGSKSRQKGLTAEERTNIAKAFCQTVSTSGYTPLFYGSKNDLSDGSWNTSDIDGTYNIWVAQYPAKPYPETEKTSYNGKYVMWQYTNKGSVSGIKVDVDLNISYLNVQIPDTQPSTGGDSATTLEPSTGEEPAVQPDPEANMKFTDCNETVTPKDAVNLRSTPEQGSNDNIVVKISNGQTVIRTGTSTSGWSRVEYEGQTLYCVSSYVTTDLDYKSGDGYTACDEMVTPKDAVNLRSSPDQGSSDNIVIKIENGTNVRRIGVNANGWSKVEYEGQILYCVSSYVKLVE